MSFSMPRECLHCGMAVSVPLPEQSRAGPACPKCDSNLLAQSDGSILTEDIAHQRETVTRALVKLEQLLDEAHDGYYAGVRLIVGRGEIHREVAARLAFRQREGRILAFDEEDGNRGALLIRIR